MRTSRRFFLSGASALAVAMVANAASAQDVIDDILKSSGRGNWDDQFDARASEGGKVASTSLSTSTITPWLCGMSRQRGRVMSITCCAVRLRLKAVNASR